jgi:hypothetical protein
MIRIAFQQPPAFEAAANALHQGLGQSRQLGAGRRRNSVEAK